MLEQDVWSQLAHFVPIFNLHLKNYNKPERGKLRGLITFIQVWEVLSSTARVPGIAAPVPGRKWTATDRLKKSPAPRSLPETPLVSKNVALWGWLGLVSSNALSPAAARLRSYWAHGFSNPPCAHTHTHTQTWDRPRWEVAKGGFCAAESALIKGKRNCTRHRLQLSSTRCRSRLPTTWASAMSAVSQESLNTLVVISIKSPSLSLPHLTYAELQPTCSGAKGGDRAQGAHVPS